MANQTAMDLVLKNLCIYPRSGENLIEQLSDCYQQFTENPSSLIDSKTSIIKQTVFISVQNNLEYVQSKQKILSCAKDFFDIIPPTSIIAQSPENDSLILEFTIIEGFQSHEIIHNKKNKNSWLILDRSDMKMLIATGCSEDSESGNILQQSNTAFTCLQNVLSEEEMEFSDIIRQWNYIEQITKNEQHGLSISQNYQIFNDVRSKYYQQANFSKGFPAATGIGMDYGGIIIDIFAAKFKNNTSVVALKSPVQLDAYSYTKEVLAENNTMEDFCRTTPKFERAKVLITPFNKLIFVSGTAAIKGQVSIPVMSVEHQTEMTIQNILSLISPENLTKHGILSREKANLNYIRVYVKYKNDIQQVKNICQKYFPGITAVYILADICRPELLVEIEGQAAIS
jgi:enamine deaminase RidA (YjgF/YER057c/UK114 family)